MDRSPLTRRSASILLSAAALLVSSTSRAEPERGAAVPDTSPARVVLPTCDPSPFDVDELLASLRLELLGCGLELRAGAPPEGEDAVVVRVDAPGCIPSDLRIRLEHSAAGLVAERTVDLSDRPEHDRGRLLALSIAELYRASRAAPAPASPQPSPPGDPAPPVAPPRERRPIDAEALRREATRAAVAEMERRREADRWPDHRVRVGADLVLTSHPVHDSGIIGARVLLDVALSSRAPVHLGLDVAYREGGGFDVLGRVRTRSATGAIALRYEGGSDRVRGAVGPRLELGWCRIEGEPREPGWEPGRDDGFILTLDLDGSFLVRLSRRLWVVAGLSLGFVLRGLDASAAGHHVGGVAGPSITASLGLAVGL